MSLAATTVSIVLTFGTTAIIERKKVNAEKREIVMMIMFDMRESIREMESCDNDLNEFFRNQVEIIAHPEMFGECFSQLATHIPILEYTTTAENIFKSNIETINTIGNLLFVETVSSFYNERVRYKEDVVNAFVKRAGEAIYDYDKLYDFDSATYPFYSQALLRSMKDDFNQCKYLMKVSDEDLDVFSVAQQKLIDATSPVTPEESKDALALYQQHQIDLQKARIEGKKSLK